MHSQNKIMLFKTNHINLRVALEGIAILTQLIGEIGS